jgi:hypothetical protein
LKLIIHIHYASVPIGYGANDIFSDWSAERVGGVILDLTYSIMTTIVVDPLET